MKIRVRGLTLGGSHLGGGNFWGALILPLILNAKFLYHTGMLLGVFYDDL